MKRKRKGKYNLIFDTGDSVFTTKKEAFSFARWLKGKGHKLDRLQRYRYSGKKYKTKPKIYKIW